jgi:putative hemolysin
MLADDATNVDTTQLPFEVSTSALLPGLLKTLARPLDPALLRFFVPGELVRSYSASRRDGQTAAEFVAGMLRQLNICYQVQTSDQGRIPASGPALIVANHPFGLLEGLILVDMLERVRPDFRIVANGLLATTPALHERVFFVNPFENASVTQNCRGLRASLDWLRHGGMLVMFPAGEVSHLNWREAPVTDPKWNSASARLACKIGCCTVPLFFEGANSLPFQMLGAIHPGLRTLNLAHELVKKRKHTVKVRVGTAIPASVLKSHGDAESATGYLRARTYLLLNRPTRPQALSRFPPRAKPLSAPGSAEFISREVACLGPERILASGGEFQVLLAPAGEIPNLLNEIGRCRELTYRAVGEGTGKAFDLDEFDRHYEHLILWHATNRRVAGGYRLAATTDILPSRGIKGLYTNTLFHYAPEFFDHIGPALELGRSFVYPEYQRHYSPLLLLWKGIAAYVQRRPECAVLFGAVSISGDYQALSRTLIVDYLKGHLAKDLIGLVRPRRGFRRHLPLPKNVKLLSRLIGSLDELSASVQDLELDGKGLPVLIRQYMKVGGQFLGFNIDPHFSNALDALICADLRVAATPMLERLMGRAGAQTFRSRHQSQICRSIP